jgi:predicted amino acid-binding ACT domain protein
VASQESESGGETEAVEAEIAELEQNLKDVEDTIGHGYATVKMFADKLAKSLGVGKFKDVHLPALQDFCFAIIDLAFADDDNMSIVAVLEPFVRLLTAEAVDAVRDKLDGKISDDPQLADALSSDRLVTGASVYVSSCIDAMCWLGTWAWRWRR